MTDIIISKAEEVPTEGRLKALSACRQALGNLGWCSKYISSIKVSRMTNVEKTQVTFNFQYMKWEVSHGIDCGFVEDEHRSIEEIARNIEDGVSAKMKQFLADVDTAIKLEQEALSAVLAR